MAKSLNRKIVEKWGWSYHPPRLKKSNFQTIGKTIKSFNTRCWKTNIKILKHAIIFVLYLWASNSKLLPLGKLNKASQFFFGEKGKTDPLSTRLSQPSQGMAQLPNP
ncbi:hypothetical protein N9M31_03130 [Alphaproteobacteria bacterium]|nr:hypothetical protein [Alphaproteobacteria bacterium]